MRSCAGSFSFSGASAGELLGWPAFVFSSLKTWLFFSREHDAPGRVFDDGAQFWIRYLSIFDRGCTSGVRAFFFSSNAEAHLHAGPVMGSELRWR